MLHLRPRNLLIVLIVSLLTGLCASQAPGKPNATHPSIILITLDTTRADRMGFLGSKRGLTPNLDELAKQGVAFSRCFAHVPLTVPSHATILSGTYPQFNHVNDMGDPLAGTMPYIPEILHQHGYATAAFIGGAVLDPEPGGAVGFQRGFDLYDADFHKRTPGEDRYHSVERRADVVVEHAIDWLAKHEQRPVFLWVHLYDPHDPYEPPEPYKARYAADLYDGEIAYTDSAVGKLIAALHEHKLYDRAMIAVMADHGEALGEHGEQTHGVFLYDETLHVPLLFKLPAAEAAGLHISGRVGLVDVAPTILQAVGIAIPDQMQGSSLLDQIQSSSQKPAADESVYAESQYGHDAYGWSSLQAWRAGKYLYVQAPRRELYDQSTDPQALRNLAPQTRAVADTMASELEGFRQKTSSKAVAKPELGPDAVEKLRALGYVTSASRSSDENAEQSGPDPKDRIEFANLMHSALIDVEEGRFDSAIPKLESALKIDPQAGPTYLELGNDLLQVKELQKSVPALKKAVSLMPDSGPAHERLGEALVETQDWPGAATAFEAAIAESPKSADLHIYLGGVYEKMNRVPDAITQYETAAKLAPKDFRANLLVGRVLGMHGSPELALGYLQTAETLDPNSQDAHRFLANVYAAMGLNDEADRERAEATRLQSQPHQ